MLASYHLSPRVYTLLPGFMVLQTLLLLLPVLTTPVPADRAFTQVQVLRLGLWPQRGLSSVSAFPTWLDCVFARVLVSRSTLGLLGLLRLLLIPRLWGTVVVLPEV